MPTHHVLTVTGKGIWTHEAKQQRNALFHAYAGEYLRISLEARSRLIRAQLLGHALELLLKTYLLTTGLGERELKRRGHNLKTLFVECRAKGLGEHLRISSAVEKMIDDFNAVHQTHDLRYASILFLLKPPAIPRRHVATRFAKALYQRLAPTVRAA